MKVFILFVLVAKQPFLGSVKVDGDAPVYRTAAACLRATSVVKEKLLKEFDMVYTECREKTIHEDK